MSLQDAIHTYHDLLTPELALETQEKLDEQLRRHDLFFGNRPLCTVLRPRFLTYPQYRFLQTSIKPLLSAFDKSYRAALESPSLLAQYGLTEWEQKLLEVDPGFNYPTPVSRLDAFYLPESETLCFTEYNAEVPAASAYNDELSEVFYGLPIMREFFHKYEVRSLSTRYRVLHALLDAFRQWSGSSAPPRIAILDWDDVPTYSEFRLFLDYCRSQGLETIICAPQEVRYEDGKLMVADFHITLI